MATKVLFFLLLALSCGKCDVLYRQVGDEAVMKCEVAQDSDVEWKLNNILIIHINGKRGNKRKGPSPVKDKISVNGGTLKVPKLEKKDSGVYFCSQSEKRYTLYVVSVFATPGSVVVQSSEVKLHCEITEDPNVGVNWLSPTNGQINDKKQVIQLKSVTSKEDGQWTCVVNDGSKFSLKLTVVGLQTNAVEVNEGSEIVLPCSLPQSVSQRVVGGKWTADHLNTVSFPTLTNSGKGLHWDGDNSSKVKFTSELLSINYDVTLMNVQRRDEGKFVCTVKFEGGAELTAKTNLTVVTKSSGGHKSTNKVKGKTPPGGETWTKDVFGLKLWVWIAISSVVLFGLIIVTVLLLLRNKRMKKKVKRLRSMRQPLTAIDYCKCNRAEREVGLEQREKPLLLPRQQRNPRTRAADHDYTIEKSKAQGY